MIDIPLSWLYKNTVAAEQSKDLTIYVYILPLNMNSCARIHLSHVWLCAAIQNLFLFNKQMFPSLIYVCVLSLFLQQNFLVHICFSNLICIIKQSMQHRESEL